MDVISVTVHGNYFNMSLLYETNISSGGFAEYVILLVILLLVRTQLI